MEHKDYAIQYFLRILEIEWMNKGDVTAPRDGPSWLMRLIDYLFCEFSNSHDGLYVLGREFSLASDFSDLKNRLMSLDNPDLEEADEKCHWKEIAREMREE
jgi:hypothetical protein